jgi:hypothetical protein
MFRIFLVGASAALAMHAYANDLAIPDYAQSKEIIIKGCVKDWPEDYHMRQVCIERQMTAVKALKDME